MRLIDAEKLMKYLPSEEPLSRWALKNAPTVEAIPIEWIKEHYAYYGIIKTLIEEWEKENETN